MSSSTSLFSPRRALIIAQSTVTQLVRMKIFYFLAPVALLFLGLQFFDAVWFEGPEALMPEQELRMHKNIAWADDDFTIWGAFSLSKGLCDRGGCVVDFDFFNVDSFYNRDECDDLDHWVFSIDCP